MNKTIPKFLVLIIAYSVLITMWFAAWLIVGDSNWWLTLLNRVVPFLFIPVPLFLIWGISSRRIKLLTPLLIPCLIFAWIYRPYLFPKPAQSFDQGTQLRVMTYNVLFSNLEYDAVANVVLAYQPDLVALQEVQPEMMDALEERLADDYPYFLMGTENTYGTTAVFSRYPFAETEIVDLQADRPAVVVKTKIKNQDITFVAIHLLAYNLWWTKLPEIPEVVMQRTVNQNQQVRTLLDKIDNEQGVVVVGCDCNSYETSSSYRIFDQFMDSAARQVGWSWGGNELLGTKQDLYFQHIDHVWFRGDIMPKRAYKIKDNGGSDHLPVLVIFDMR